MPETSRAACSTYRLFGLSVRSELPLVDLAPVAAVADADVVIVRTPTVEPVDKHGVSMAGNDMVLEVADVARYTMSGGRTIRIEAAPDASERNVRLFLMGSAFGALLHQRGLLPLHANAIDMGGYAIAFTGHSGAGKSTMAAWFEARGKRVLADDVCVVSLDENGGAQAHAGMPRLRLWREAIEKGGRDAGEFQRSFDGMDKYDVPTRSAESDACVPLAAVYRLGRCEPGEPSREIRRLAGIEAVDALVANTYRGAYLKQIGGVPGHLASCVALARSVPVFTADRAWGYECFDAEAGKLEAHAAAAFGPEAPE